jgi:hypothetical protein
MLEERQDLTDEMLGIIPKLNLLDSGNSFMRSQRAVAQFGIEQCSEKSSSS